MKPNPLCVLAVLFLLPWQSGWSQQPKAPVKAKAPSKEAATSKETAPSKGKANAPVAARKPPLSPKQLRREVVKKPVGPAATALAQRITAMFGKAALEGGKASPRFEETTVAWAAKSPSPVTVVRGDGVTVGPMNRIGDDGVQVLVQQVPNFSDFDYALVADGKKIGGGHVRIEHYAYGEDSFPRKGVPKGKIEKHVWAKSKVFPDTTRAYLVYVPAQYKPEEPACVMVFQDGLRHADPNGPMRATTVFDNLIHKGDLPVTIGIFIDPGANKGQKPGGKPQNRSFEYDSLGDAYARFLRDEILPEVAKKYSLRTDPGSRAIAGGSSGGICAWTVAWEMPEEFGKVLCWVGTFVDIRGGHNYPPLIRKTEPKPIRVFLLDGSNDLDNQYGNWPLANQQMAAALKYSGYDYKFHYGKCFHGSKHASALLPEMLRWLWRE